MRKRLKNLVLAMFIDSYPADNRYHVKSDYPNIYISSTDLGALKHYIVSSSEVRLLHMKKIQYTSCFNAFSVLLTKRFCRIFSAAQFLLQRKPKVAKLW